jgi:multidrug resistance protein
MSSQAKRQLVLLFLTLLIVMVGFGIILPILPFFAQSMGASATHLGLLFACFSLMQFISSPLWGGYSDRIGRRPVLLLGLVGMALSFVLFGLAQSLWMLFAARILGGLLSSSVVPAAMAYVADSTRKEQRGRSMGLMGAAMGVGLVFGPALGGFLGALSPATPFFVAAGLTLLVAAFASFFLPESLQKRSIPAVPSPLDRTSSASAFGDLFRAVRGSVGFLLILGFISNFAIASLFGTFALFAEAQFGFGEKEMGAVFVTLGLISALGQGFFVGRMIQRWTEERVIHIGLVVSGVGFLSLLLAYDLVSLMVCTAVLSLGTALLGPALSSLVSQRTPADQQGTIMGVLNSYGSLGRILGPLLGGVVFDVLGHSAPFVISGFLFLLTWLGCSMLWNRSPSASVEAGE